MYGNGKFQADTSLTVIAIMSYYLIKPTAVPDLRVYSPTQNFSAHTQAEAAFRQIDSYPFTQSDRTPKTPAHPDTPFRLHRHNFKAVVPVLKIFANHKLNSRQRASWSDFDKEPIMVATSENDRASNSRPGRWPTAGAVS